MSEEDLEESNERKSALSCGKWEEGLRRSMFSPGALDPHPPLLQSCPLHPCQSKHWPLEHESRTCIEPVFPGWSTLKHAWPCKCHLKPRLSIVAARSLPQFSHLSSAEKKGRKGWGQSSTMPSSSPLHLS